MLHDPNCKDGKMYPFNDTQPFSFKPLDNIWINILSKMMHIIYL